MTCTYQNGQWNVYLPCRSGWLTSVYWRESHRFLSQRLRRRGMSCRSDEVGDEKARRFDNRCKNSCLPSAGECIHMWICNFTWSRVSQRKSYNHFLSFCRIKFTAWCHDMMEWKWYYKCLFALSFQISGPYNELRIIVVIMAEQKAAEQKWDFPYLMKMTFFSRIIPKWWQRLDVGLLLLCFHLITVKSCLKKDLNLSVCITNMNTFSFVSKLTYYKKYTT